MDKPTEKSVINPQWALSARQGRRKTMEDTHIHLLNYNGPRTSIFGIFDGHGGDRAAKLVERDFVTEFKKQLLETKPSFKKIDAINSALTQTCNKIDTYITAQGIASGTTALVACIEDNQLSLAWVGDSRAIVIRDGEIVLATMDHKPNDPVEQSRIEKAGGRVEKYGVWRVDELALSRSLGDFKIKAKHPGAIIATPDIFDLTLQDNDIIVLACDGIWDVFNNEEVKKIVLDALRKTSLTGNSSDLLPREEIQEFGNNIHISLVARHLINSAFKKGSNDNLSALIIQYRK